MSVFYFVFLFASSIFYPLEPLPAWFRWAAWANPLTWQVDLMRYSSIGVGDPGIVFVETAAFVVFSLGAFAYAVRCLQQQD
jgi:ABC-type polysaccharide/polyol phosphate export permease